MVYDEATKLLYVGHGGSTAAAPGRVAVVDVIKLVIIDNLPMETHPEALEIDPVSHRIFANVADAAKVAVIDGATRKVTARWPLTGAKDNVPLAFVPESQALLLAVVAAHRSLSKCERWQTDRLYTIQRGRGRSL
jgi:hypothetical protein